MAIAEEVLVVTLMAIVVIILIVTTCVGNDSLEPEEHGALQHDTSLQSALVCLAPLLLENSLDVPEARSSFTYSLHCSSFWGLPFRIPNLELVKPKKGTTMETIRRPRSLHQGPQAT